MVTYCNGGDLNIMYSLTSYMVAGKEIFKKCVAVLVRVKNRKNFAKIFNVLKCFSNRKKADLHEYQR